MIELRLPRLVGTREAVIDLLDEQNVASELEHARVVVFCRELSSASPSFADELVAELLERRHAGSLLLVAPPARFKDYMTEAAERRDAPSFVVVSNGADVFA